MDHALKALDSLVGANYEQKDLSPVITARSGPERPLLRAIQVADEPAKGKTHYWDEVDLIKPGHGAATYLEGSKPPADSNPPDQLNNIVCRIGKVAQVTDTMSAIWRGFRLADGELEAKYSKAMDLQVTLKTSEVLNEGEWMLLNGDRTNPEGWQGLQCDGIRKWITTNVVVAGTTSAPFDVSSANAAAFEALVKKLARQIKGQQTPTVPNLVTCSTLQKDGINSFVGGGAGRPLVQVVTDDSGGYVGGSEVDSYQTGFFRVSVKISPQQELIALAGKLSPPTTNELLMIDTQHFSRADLIPFHAEPLARVNTTLERMITWEFTLEARNERSSGKITGLVA